MHASSDKAKALSMASTSQPAAAIGEGNEERKEEVAPPSEAAGNRRQQLVLPEDGYEWKKYGQKLIKNIQKNRSYYRCRHKLCGAKKKVEWHPSDPSGDLRIVYKGAHQHGAPPSSAHGTSGVGGGGGSNQYELGAQYFGGARSH